MKTKVTIILSVAVLALGILGVLSFVGEDRKPPVITVPEQDMTYYQSQDESVLLAGVRAYDNQDGDVSSRVRIYDVAVISGEKQALVTYAVYDNNYNLGKATKLVWYVPLGDVGASEITATGEVAEIEDTTEVTTEDTTETTTEEPEEGFDDPELVSDGSPVIRLKTHYVNIQVGDDFYSMDYVEDIVDDEDDRNYLFRFTYLDGDYDVDEEGEYELTYYCVDSDGNKSNIAKLILTVGDEKDEEE
ncbi:MAG: hypothetical protein E7257_00300 [Lachnospiraceae bacterium]|nr:hypothetical protein [Lachnospiraceae bacterium]MBQ9936239.1 hypothetical protein [Lachnospiraceae bacterium]